jgi:hypothetical protein
MWLLLGELTASDAVLGPDDLLGELGVLEGPEAEETGLQLAVIRAVDVVLSVTDGDQVGIGDVDVDAGDVAALGGGALEGEERLQVDLVLLHLLLFLLLFFLLVLLLLLLADADAQPALLVRLFLV